MARTGLDVVDALDRAQVERICRQPVKRVGRHAQHFAGTDLIGGIFDQRRFRGLATDFYNLDAHGRSLLFCYRLDLFRPRNLP